jgi:hypothetical protein
MKQLIFLMLILNCQNLFATAKWESLGDNFYIDKASQELYGDISHINFRGGDTIIPLKVDCKRDVIISPAQFVGRVVEPNSIMQTVIKRACEKKWYQIFNK